MITLLKNSDGQFISGLMGADKSLSELELDNNVTVIIGPEGDFTENVGTDVDSWSMRQPLGVCAGITPFNFPAMIPLWMFPMAIACGNTFVLKPSEQDPMTPNRLAELFIEAGAPKGLLQVIHGTKEQVDQVLTHKDIKAISFVGSVPVGQYIYKTGTDNLKRVQAFAGAKNHMVVMPDADKQRTIDNLVGASVGAAGQRCMAISVAIFVGESKNWIEDVKTESELIEKEEKKIKEINSMEEEEEMLK